MDNFELFVSQLVSGIGKKARHLARGDDSLADDLKQEALLACLRVFRRYENVPPEDLVRLAGRAAVNAMTDAVRKLSHRGTELELESDEREPLVDRKPSPVAVALARDQYAALYAALNEKQRAVLSLLAYDDGETFLPSGRNAVEIGRRLRMGTSTVFAVQAELRKLAVEVCSPA